MVCISYIYYISMDVLFIFPSYVLYPYTHIYIYIMMVDISYFMVVDCVYIMIIMGISWYVSSYTIYRYTHSIPNVHNQESCVMCIWSPWIKVRSKIHWLRGWLQGERYLLRKYLDPQDKYTCVYIYAHTASWNIIKHTRTHSTSPYPSSVHIITSPPF